MAIGQRSSGELLLHGIVGGIVAGIVFAMAEMVMAVFLGGSFWAPLQMIGAIVLGPGVLPPATPTAFALIVGLIFHMIMSAIFGVIFVYLLAFTHQIAASASLLLLYGSLFGFALWIVDFLIISQYIAFPWFFRGANQFWMGFVAHTFFFGTVLGGYVAAVLRGRVATFAR